MTRSTSGQEMADQGTRAASDMADNSAPCSRALPLSEAVGPLGLRLETAYRLLAVDQFPVPAFRIRRRWFVRSRDLDAFLHGP